ncbi:MAG TPA: ribose-phosphate diphosphokinase [Kofleriaceae bacterium]|jgi:ribose-phosphate pyrophosphokinase|nr:ribose-phosphate diphosphokinase [Kofleriaceae bacterium]
MTTLFATEAYDYLARALSAHGFAAGVIDRRRFPDGERYLRLDGDLRDIDVALVGGTISDADTLEIYDLACAAVKYGARRLTLVIPYFGYSTMERAEHPGEVVTAKTRARLLSSIPSAAMGNRVVLVDLHAAGIAHYFEGDMWPVPISARPLIEPVARRLGGDDFVLGCTDAGRAKWVESLASGLGVVPAFAYKRRLSGDRTTVTGVSAHVRGKPVVIYDDMIRTGSSLLGAARAYHDAGATRVAAICTHGLFPGDALDRIRASGLIDAVVATDTHPRARQLAGDYLEVLEIAPLLAQTLEERT